MTTRQGSEPQTDYKKERRRLGGGLPSGYVYCAQTSPRTTAPVWSVARCACVSGIRCLFPHD